MRIPGYAKRSAREGLRKRAILPPSRRFGLDKGEAETIGINSGVERARQIIRNDYLHSDDIMSMAAFYQRFRNCRTPKCEGAMLLWGGRKFLREKVVPEAKRLR